jgi:hypothetical protein
MVLDNASSSNSSDSFADSAPSDDADPYSDSQSGNITSSRIDTTNFPKPIPILGSMAGYNDEFFRKVTTERLKLATQVLGRSPSQEEASAFGYYVAKHIAIHSYGAPVGIAAGMWRAYNSRSTFRFPFHQPNLETFQADVFPSQRLALLKGFNAIAGWHIARASAYGVVGIFFSQLIFGGYATTVSTVGQLQDPRLKAFASAIQARTQKRQGSLPGIGTPGAPSSLPNGGRPAGTHHDGRDDSPQDDASPTGDMFREEDTAASRDNLASGLGGDTQMEKAHWPPARPVPVQTRHEPESQPFDAWDDASPTGGQSMADDTVPAPQGSAWERLRRGEKPASIPQKSGAKQPNQNPWMRRQNETQKEQREGSTMGDSFAFSKSEEERTYAKEEAQKEFDARVERERRGGDFSKGGGDQKRW